MGYSGVKAHQFADSAGSSVQAFDDQRAHSGRSSRVKPGHCRGEKRVWRGDLKSAERNIQALRCLCSTGPRLSKKSLKTNEKQLDIVFYIKTHISVNYIPY
jgi:hypothetical protein